MRDACDQLLARLTAADLYLAGLLDGAACAVELSAQRQAIDVVWTGPESGHTTGRWTMTETYERMDSSEKSAVSYFLGMTQAKITSARLLGVPHLVHLDAILAILNKRLGNQSRPDFVGFDPASRTFSIGVEAKGRTGGCRSETIWQAKEQVMRLPTIVGATSRLRVASVASFGADKHWRAYLEDANETHEEADPVAAGAVLGAYYRPLVGALHVAGLDDEASPDERVELLMPGMDMYLGLPMSVVRILSYLPPTGPVPTAELEAAGADLIGALGDLDGNQVSDEPGPVEENEADMGSAAGAVAFTGQDGVSVRLGPSWFQAGPAPVSR